MTDKRILKLKCEIQRSRSRIIDIQPSFAHTLRNLTYVASDNVFRISANRKYIYFDPNWLQRLRAEELDFILAHQVMHIKLGHIDRSIYFKGKRFHLACDIIANSYLKTFGWEYSALPHIGTIYHQTFYPVEEGITLTPEEAMKKVPFDPALGASRKKYVIDSDLWWGKKDAPNENDTIILRPGEEDPYDKGKIYKEDEINKALGRKSEPKLLPLEFTDTEFDDEDDLDIDYEPPETKTWDKKAADSIKSLQQAKDEDRSDENADERTRFWKHIRRSRLDWRTLLNVFVREEIYDYSFTPPDRRFMDGDFFLPDYNVPNEKTKNILFMVDTSISIGDEILSVVYSELCSALDQFGGALEGVLAFFDTKVYQPTAFSSIDELKNIRPVGGGGTDFRCIFEFVRNKMQNELPLSIVVFTDGKGDLPPEEAAMDIPVLWMITNTHSLPEWGKCVVVEK